MDFWKTIFKTIGWIKDETLLIASAPPFTPVISPPPPPPPKFIYPTEKVNGFIPKGIKGTGSRFFYRIDLGHGKYTRGKRSPVFQWLGKQIRFFEYDFNQLVGHHLFKLLLEDKTLDFEELVPDHSQVGNIVRERVKRLNETYSRRDIVLSIHANAAASESGDGWTTVEGYEAWVYKWRKSSANRGVKFGKLWLSSMRSVFPEWRNRGLKFVPAEKYLFLIAEALAPVTLFEFNFFNNKKIVRLLMRDATAQKCAKTIFETMKAGDKIVYLD